MSRGAVAVAALVALTGCAGGPAADGTATQTNAHTAPDCGLGTGDVVRVLETNHTVENATAARKLAERVANESVAVSDGSPIGHAGDIRERIADRHGPVDRLYFADAGDHQRALAVTGDGDVYWAYLGAC